MPDMRSVNLVKKITVTKITLADKLKALELLGKYFNLFTNR
jgi:hypothetical protein